MNKLMQASVHTSNLDVRGAQQHVPLPGGRVKTQRLQRPECSLNHERRAGHPVGRLKSPNALASSPQANEGAFRGKVRESVMQQHCDAVSRDLRAWSRCRGGRCDASCWDCWMHVPAAPVQDQRCHRLPTHHASPPRLPGRRRCCKRASGCSASCKPSSSRCCVRTSRWAGGVSWRLQNSLPPCPCFPTFDCRFALQQHLC